MEFDKQLSPDALLLLVDIVDSGNLSRAAQKLKMSRANMSYRLAQIEKSLGQQLIRRTTRRIEPTELGLRLYQHGSAVRDELLAATESVAVLGKGLSGLVRMSVPTGFGLLVMSDWLIDFKRQFPGIALELVFNNRVDDLLKDEVDIAIRVMSEPPQQMVATELAPVTYVACVSSTHGNGFELPDDPEGLARVPLITSAVYGRELRLAAYRGAERHEVLLRPTLASENFQFLQKALLAGLGVALVPDYVVRAEIDAGSVLRALPDWRLSIFGNRMFMLRMPGRYQTLAVRTLMDFVVERSRQWSR